MAGFRLLGLAAAMLLWVADTRAQMSADAHFGADAVIEEDLWDYELEITSTNSVITNVTRKVRKRLFRNIEEYATVQFTLANYSSLKEFRARTILPTGAEIPLAGGDLHRISGHGGGATLYADFETYRFTFPAIERGCAVEYEYRIRKDATVFNTTWWIQDELPKQQTEFRIAIPEVLLDRAGWEWRYRIYNHPDLGTPEMSTRAYSERATTRRKREFGWTVRDVPAFEREPRMPPSKLFLAHVVFGDGDWDDWNDPARWYAGRYFDSVVKDDQQVVARLAREATEGAATPREQLERLHRYVQGIRYEAIILGDGGLRPSPPRVVAERGYGDCKDKSTLLIAMARALGLEAHPALVLTADEGRIDPNFAQFPFNHMIVQADLGDGEPVWIDPTVPYCPLGQIPYGVQGLDALVLHEKRDGYLERTPLSTAEENRVQAEAEVTLQPGGSADATVTLRFTGAPALVYRSRLAEASREDLEDLCRDELNERLGSREILESDIRNLRSLDDPLELHFRVHIRDAYRQQGDLAFLAPEFLDLMEIIPEILEPDRRYPFEFAFPAMVEQSVVFRTGAVGLRSRNVPEDIALEGDRMRFRRAAAANGEGVAYRTEFLLTHTNVGLQDWARTYEFLQAVRRARAEEIILQTEGSG